MTTRASAFSALALLAALLSGCTGGTDPELSTAPDGRILDGEGRQVDAKGQPVVAPVQIPAPVWQVGQSWTQEWLVDGGTDPFIVQSVVAEATPAGYLLATPSLVAASLHGAFTLPTLGRFAPSDLTATADGGTWPWYKFPLTENLTWQASLSTKDGMGGTYEQSWTLQARNVTASRADIVAKVGDATVAAYDFDNRTGWFTEARFFSEEGFLQFHVRVTEATKGYKGELLDATGEMLMESEFEGEPGTVSGSPYTQFDVDADATHLLAFGYAYAAGGASASVLASPEGDTYPLHTDPAAALAGSGVGGMLVTTAVPGTWHFATGGAGAFAWGGGAQVFGITVRTLQV